MDVNRLNNSLQTMKDQLRNLMSVSASLIERNSQLDSGARCENLPTPPKFEASLEDFLSSCNMIELSLRTMQECLIQGKANVQNLPIAVSNMKHDNLDARVEAIEPNTQVSYNQFLSVIRYQVDTANAIKAIIEEFVNQTKK